MLASQAHTHAGFTLVFTARARRARSVAQRTPPAEKKTRDTNLKFLVKAPLFRRARAESDRELIQREGEFLVLKTCNVCTPPWSVCYPIGNTQSQGGKKKEEKILNPEYNTYIRGFFFSVYKDKKKSLL